jgi:predicted ATPase
LKHTLWCVVTGAPCSGKTTVLQALEQLGYRVIPEVGRALIENQLALGRPLEDIKQDQSFRRNVVATKIQIEQDLLPEDFVFMDRALPDSITFGRAAGVDTSEVFAASQKFRYKHVFFFDRLPMQNDGIRFEDDRTAAHLDHQLQLDYRSLGYDLIRVPLMTVEERVAFILNHLFL